jgi:hypothetical protein
MCSFLAAVATNSVDQRQAARCETLFPLSDADLRYLIASMFCVSQYRPFGLINDLDCGVVVCANIECSFTVADPANVVYCIDLCP